MRYASEETTHILAVFGSGASVTISIYRLSDDSKVVDNASCSEVDSTGVFKYSFSYSTDEKEEFLWIMTDGVESKYGKIVVGGYTGEIEAIRKITLNKVVKSGNQITVYDDDGQTVWKKFNLAGGRVEI